MSYATRLDAGIVNSANCCARLRAVCQGMSETLSETILRGNPRDLRVFSACQGCQRGIGTLMYIGILFIIPFLSFLSLAYNLWNPL